jgi:hypothetical protein
MENTLKLSFLILVGMMLSFVLSITFGTPEFAIALMTTLFNSLLRFVIVITCILLAVVIVGGLC